MIPGACTTEGQLRVVAGPPATTDPRLGGFALTPLGEIYAVGTQSAFTPASLFLNGEEGAWYDPSDLTTMFQDSVGTTPVTADGQPVGLILDKSKGLVLGPELAVNGDFSNGTGWTLSAGFTISGGKLNVNSSDGSAQNTSGAVAQSGKYYRVAFTVDSISGGTLYVALGGWSYQIASAGTYTLYRLSSSNNYLIFGVSTGTPVAVIDNVSFKLVSGNHASQATAASRPLYKTDGTYHWLQFDGVDDRLSTAAISFTSTDKMSVFNGVKVSGTTNQGFYAVGTGGNGRCDGTFLAGASPVNRASLLGGTGGITQVSTPAAGAAPKSYVISHLFDIAGASATDEIKNRQNGALGTQTVVAAGPAGGGNFSTIPIVIGDMSLGAAPLNGNIYSIIVRGAMSTPQEITDTETWVNNKTGAF